MEPGRYASLLKAWGCWAYDLTTERTEMDEYSAVQLEDSDMALTTQSRTWESMQLSPQPSLPCC